jgi:aquaporin Z
VFLIQFKRQQVAQQDFMKISQGVREAITEGIGTFILIFTGTGAVVVNALEDGVIGHLGISLIFGAVVAALIYSTGHISQAHLNPAVTLAFWSSGFFPKKKVIPYI